MDSRTASFEGKLEPHSPSYSQAVGASSSRKSTSSTVAIQCNMTGSAQHISWNGSTKATIQKSLGKGKKKTLKSPGKSKLSGETVRNSGSTLRVPPELQVVITRKPLTTAPATESNTSHSYSVRNNIDTTHSTKLTMGSPTRNDVRQETVQDSSNHENPFGGGSKSDDNDEDTLMIVSRSDGDATTNKIDQDHLSSAKACPIEQAPSYQWQTTPHSPPWQKSIKSFLEENNLLQQRYFNVTGLDGCQVDVDHQKPKQMTRCLSCGALGHVQQVCPGLKVSIIVDLVSVPSTYMAYQPFYSLSRYLYFNLYRSRPMQFSLVY